ncbi:MAG: PAS domain S-box protein [Deltaproteobacteria bacterium]|nr:PAS domain S-box protein [Deltaproteobacteria bacterium]
MPQPLKILFVEDDVADVELERAALRHEYAVSVSVVDSPEAFETALREGHHEVVLCDYTLPRFSGMAALAIWRAAGARIPFIYVSGTLSEELAVESIKAGATDYVLKGNLTRLPAAVDRALREFAAARSLRRTEAQRARVAAAVEQAEEMVLITEPDGTIVYANPAFTRITGYTAEEAIGRTPRLLRSGKQDEAFYADMWRRITRGEVWHGELINRRRDGRLYDAELTIAPVINSAGQIVNFSSIQRDVSERVAAERQLRELNAQLAETDRLKDAFLAAFSHELRTPLHVIMGYTEIMAETLGAQLDAAARGMFEAIGRNAGQLARLINETLDLARLRIDTLPLQLSTVDTGALVRELADSFAPLAASKHLRLTCEVPAAPIEAITDPLRLREVLGNLLDNAIKFTEAGEVRILATCDNGALVVEVQDTGIGVAGADIPRIFEDFRQLDDSPTRRYGGCGLGLAVSKRLLALLGGSIEVESEPGRGSCFRVRLPRTRPPGRPIAPKQPRR